MGGIQNSTGASPISLTLLPYLRESPVRATSSAESAGTVHQALPWDEVSTVFLLCRARSVAVTAQALLPVAPSLLKQF